MLRFRPHLIRSVPLVIAAAALACGGENLNVPTTGSVQVTTATSGAVPDPGGYAVIVDGSDRGTLGVSGTLTVEGLAPGDHLVGLSGVAGNCQVQGDNPRTSSVTAGATTTAAFAITCTALPANSGTLQITTATSGSNPDPDGYTVAVDGGTTQTIASNATLPVSGIAAGPHTVTLAGFAPNCAVGGDNPITITVTAGQTASADFSISCTVDVLVGAGDIAKCNNGNSAELTAKLLDGISGTVFALGDNAYQDGTAAEFANCYGPTWGRHKQRTRPALGNHEYRVSPNPYFDYFNGVGSASGPAGPRGEGYYSYNVGAWHIVVLNSVTKIRQDASSPQANWLKADLAANRTRCTLAYWHHPFFTSGPNLPAKRLATLVKLLYDAGAEVVLSGHNHQYERFAPQDPSRRADPGRGIRAFVVGTGGAGVYSFERRDPNSEVRYGGGHGVLKLTLSPTSYTWEFVPVAGTSFRDSGEGTCH